MRYGLTEQTIQQINSVFEKHPVVKQAVLYGSRAKGNYKPGSDIDLSLFGEDISQREVNRILDEIDALDLPYTIDMTVFRDITHAKFRDHIARVGVVFYQQEDKSFPGRSRDGSEPDCNNGDGEDAVINGWKTLPLSDFCLVLTDGNWIETKDQSSGGIRLVQTGNIGCGFFKDKEEKSRWISVDTFDRLNCFEVIPGDCLISRLPDPVGRACIVPDTGSKMITAVDCSIARFKEKLMLRDWFVYYSQSKKYISDVNIHCTGATRSRISRKNLGLIGVPSPSVDEQKRIITILDDAFERIDAAIANTEKNIANARELFESYLTDAFFRAGRAWKTCRLGEICKLQNGFVFKSNLFKQSGMPVLRISSIQDELVCDNRPVFADPKDYKEDLRKYEVNDGDLLIAMSGATTGKVGFNRTGQTYLLNQRVGRFVPKQGLSIDYLFLFLLTKQEESLNISAGSAQPNLSTKQINDFMLPFPGLDEQIVFVDKSLAVRESVLSIAEGCQSKLSALNELKQSLLQKAFSGELTSDFNPDALEH